MRVPLWLNKTTRNVGVSVFVFLQEHFQRSWVPIVRLQNNSECRRMCVVVLQKHILRHRIPVVILQRRTKRRRIPVVELRKYFQRRRMAVVILQNHTQRRWKWFCKIAQIALFVQFYCFWGWVFLRLTLAVHRNENRKTTSNVERLRITPMNTI